MTKVVSNELNLESKSSSIRSTTESAFAVKAKRQETKIVEMTRILSDQTNKGFFNEILLNYNPLFGEPMSKRAKLQMPVTVARQLKRITRTF